MQVVINISPIAYQAILSANNVSGNWGDDLLGVFCRGVANGTPLDKIISEATSLKISYTDHDKDTYRRGVNDVLKIIDKYKTESETKE